jgi:hypothetical protein
MQSTCTIGGDANDMQEHAQKDFRNGRISSCVLLKYHKINRETCLRDGEIRQIRPPIFIAIVISTSLM